MSKKAAIIGLGARGVAWAELFRDAGWVVSGFDPDPEVMGLAAGTRGWRRAETISSTVARADWVLCCVSDRLELMTKIIQRAQAEAPREAIIAVTSRRHDAEAVQGCAIRAQQVVLLSETEEGAPEVGLTHRNAPDLRVSVLATLSEVCPAAVFSSGEAEPDQFPDARSA